MVFIWPELLQIVTELPASTNWNFDVHWYPKIPGVISASSFDGKIGLYNVEVYSFGAYSCVCVILPVSEYLNSF